jgi:hypothetical protein
MEMNQNFGTVENLAAHCKWNWERLFSKEDEPSLDLFYELADWLFSKGIISFQKIHNGWFWVFIDKKYKKFSIPNKLKVFLPLLNKQK